jgi:serine/threonine protein kinase
MSRAPTVVAGRYRLGSELGSGGMGVVWEAYDELLHRTVAVKEVRYPAGIDAEERDKLARRTLREARAVAAVEDPNAVRVFDIVEQDNRPWLVMELVRGRTLTDVIREQGALPAREVVRIGAAVLEALDAAHSAGVLHRDVKPSNVILGDDGRVALTDFGIATVDSDPADVTTSGQLVGSPAYMAPERARGERPTPAADLWSLGATLWTAAEGRPPYAEGNAFATMTKVVTEDPPPCARCDSEVGAVIAALMARDPDARPSADEARQRLQALARAEVEDTVPYPTEPLPPAFDRTVALERPVAEPTPEPSPVTRAEPPPVTQPPRRPRRGRLPLLLGGLALLALAAALVAVVLSGRDAGSTPGSSGATGPAATPKQSHPSSAATAAGLPAGWRRYTDPSAGWSVGVPPGWQVQRQGSETFLRDGAQRRYLQVDTTSSPGPSAKGAWENQERSFRASHSGYRRIRLETVDWRGYDDVADWEFTYTEGGATLHALDRGAVVGDHGYGLFFQTHAGDWTASQGMLSSFLETFRPAD